jgi:hypothetical protein
MSTYSSNLRIELITTGTQAGTWGNTTNDNLSTVLEQAIAGNVSITTASASQALTYLNGPTSTASANQSVRAILTLNTSTGADFAVYAPPVSKQYTIKNASAYNATIYNSTVIGNTTAAGTGVAIPAGQTMTVWTDGTNFAQQNTYLNSPTIATPALSSPAMTGTPTAPTATYGTSTTQVATTAFVQAALQALHPIGSIYTSTVSTNPATLFGFGTWVAYGAGRVLIGTDGSTYLPGATGGSADAIVVSHTHTASSTFTGNALGTHSHTATDSGHTHTIGTSSGNNDASGTGPTPQSGSSYTTNTGYANISVGATSAGTPSGSVSTTVNSAGSSGTGANLQPYVVVYMWTRTA